MTENTKTISGVTVGETWVHHSGREYKVIGFANLYTENPDKHPIHVLYAGNNDRVWTRPLNKFVQKFTLSPVEIYPTPTVSDSGLHPATADLLRRFALALSEKLTAAQTKYGYSDGWLSVNWMDECRAKLLEHVIKGDPRDVAAYCAFLWHHGESTVSAQDESIAHNLYCILASKRPGGFPETEATRRAFKAGTLISDTSKLRQAAEEVVKITFEKDVIMNLQVFTQAMENLRAVLEET